MNNITTWARGNVPLLVLGAAGLLIALVVVWSAVRVVRKAGREGAISILINVAALMATSVQASGMWKFFGNTMGLPVGFRVVLFSFMEIALLACGLRARANVEDGGDAGVDGVLVWVLAIASGLMSSTEASSPQEALMRVLVAVVVALLWTRDLMAAKKAARAVELAAGGGKKRSGPVRWRITPERIAVWLRLADAIDTNVSTVDAARRVTKYLRQSDRERDGWRFPFTASARAYRGRMRLIDIALKHGDPTKLLRDLSTDAFDDAKERLGVRPDGASKRASGVHPETDVPADQPRNSGRTRRASGKRSGSGSKRASRSASKRLDETQLAAEAERLNAESWAAENRPVSLRKLQAELHIGQPKATALLEALAAASENASEDAPQGASGMRIPLALGEPIRPLASVNGTAQH